jgi:hypothetical protein
MIKERFVFFIFYLLVGFVFELYIVKEQSVYIEIYKPYYIRKPTGNKPIVSLEGELSFFYYPFWIRYTFREDIL